jgi:hypothetical protein
VALFEDKGVVPGEGDRSDERDADEDGDPDQGLDDLRCQSCRQTLFTSAQRNNGHGVDIAHTV